MLREARVAGAVMRRDRLLEEAIAEIGQRPADDHAHRRRHRPSWRRHRARYRRRRACGRAVRARSHPSTGVAELDLDLAEAGCERRRDLGLDRRVVEPVDRGGVGGTRVRPMPPSSLCDRLVAPPCRQCPRARCRPPRSPRPVARRAGRRARRASSSKRAPVGRVLADQARRQHLVDQARIAARAAPGQPLAKADDAVAAS